MTDLPKPVIAIPLRIALLCATCEAIFYGTEHCPVCGDSQALPLEKCIGTIREWGGTDTAPDSYPLTRGD